MQNFTGDDCDVKRETIPNFSSAIFIERVDEQDVTLKLSALKTEKQAVVFSTPQ